MFIAFIVILKPAYTPQQGHISWAVYEEVTAFWWEDPPIYYDSSFKREYPMVINWERNAKNYLFLILAFILFIAITEYKKYKDKFSKYYLMKL